jgi:hypothetical protein
MELLIDKQVVRMVFWVVCNTHVADTDDSNQILFYSATEFSGREANHWPSDAKVQCVL